MAGARTHPASVKTRRVAGALVAGALALGTGSPAGPAHAGDLPNLVVASVSATPSTAPAGTPVLFRATIRNTGRGASPAGVVHRVAFAVDGQVVSWSDKRLDPLAPGASAIVTANDGRTGTATWTATKGRHSLRASVDDVRRITEVRETDNTRTTSLVVAAASSPAPVTGLVATPAPTPAEFKATQPKTVRLAWQVPAGQPVGTQYTVTEHPADEWATCGPAGPVVKTTTPAAAAVVSISAGLDCFGHGSEHRVAYSVTATAPGTRGAESARSGPCTWHESTNAWAWGQRTWSLGCEGSRTLHATDNGEQMNAVDAGSTSDTHGYEADQGFDGGSAHVRAFPALPTHLTTSRWGFRSYSLRVPPGRHAVVLRFVEPTFSSPGRRVFDLTANGVLVADALDVYAEVGRGREHVISTTVDAPDGVVRIVPRARVDHPIVAAIETSPL